jgi:hypothetical protein
MQDKLSDRKREQHLSFKMIYNLSTYSTKTVQKMNRKIKYAKTTQNFPNDPIVRSLYVFFTTYPHKLLEIGQQFFRTLSVKEFPRY